MAYELHKPQLQRKDKTRPKQTSETEAKSSSIDALQHVPMEQNMAYELHKPQRLRDQSGPKQCSQTTNTTYYEEIIP